MSERIEILIAKYFSEGLSSNETQKLISWIEASDNNKGKFNDYIDLNFTIEQLKSEGQDDSVLWKHIESSFKAPVRKLNYWKYAAAASVLIIVALTIFLNKGDDTKFEQIIVNNNIETGTDKATLTLADGSDITLEKGQKYVADNLSSNGEEIIYQTTSTTNPEIAYNYLTIPRGGQYFIKLPDGTQVWLNSESKLKYPVSFVKGETREVELVYGEAYFDVSSSANHDGSKFKVFSGIQEIEVLGTEFNVKAYKDEGLIYTTLIEGKVAIDVANNNREILKPNEQSILNKSNKDIIITEADVYSETAWKKGLFSFRDKSLKDIMKVLSRWYDVDVTFVDKKLEDIQFKGVLSKYQNIEEILILIKNTNFINAYEIEDNKIIIIN